MIHRKNEKWKKLRVVERMKWIKKKEERERKRKNVDINICINQTDLQWRSAVLGWTKWPKPKGNKCSPERRATRIKWSQRRTKWGWTQMVLTVMTDWKEGVHSSSPWRSHSIWTRKAGPQKIREGEGTDTVTKQRRVYRKRRSVKQFCKNQGVARAILRQRKELSAPGVISWRWVILHYNFLIELFLINFIFNYRPWKI